MRPWIGAEPSHFISRAMIIYSRALKDMITAVTRTFMPTLPLTQARVAIKCAKNCPWNHVFNSVWELHRPLTLLFSLHGPYWGLWVVRCYQWVNMLPMHTQTCPWAGMRLTFSMSWHQSIFVHDLLCYAAYEGMARCWTVSFWFFGNKHVFKGFGVQTNIHISPIHADIVPYTHQIGRQIYQK